MANHRATGKKAKHGAELAQRLRAAVLNTFDAIEESTNKTISQILAEKYSDDPMKLIDLASKLIPKERMVDVSGHISQTIEHRSVSETDTRIEELFGNGKDQHPAPPLSH